MKQTVILHIGHPKTGSSAIQSFLASSVDELAQEGIRYPEHASFDRAQRGGVSSGNCPNKASKIFEKVTKEASQCSRGDRLLFSNELMFDQREEICRNISKLGRNFQFEVILFIRNPSEMAMSSYQQSIKRNGETRTFEECAQSERFLLEAEFWHRDLVALGVKNHVINYSKTKGRTIRRFLEALDCPEMLRHETYATAEKRIVNRSLSPIELKLVRAANQDFGAKIGRELSDRLIEISPSVRPQEYHLSNELMEVFRERFGSSSEYFNQILPEGEGIDIAAHKSENMEAREPGREIEEFSSIAAAFNSAMMQRDPKEVKALQMERDEFLQDIKSRKSRLAYRIDYWDYRIHALLARIQIFGTDFRERFRIAAERRHRRCYDE